MTNAAALYLNGHDPVGEPYLATRSPLVREVWVAIGVRAGQLIDQAKAKHG